MSSPGFLLRAAAHGTCAQALFLDRLTDEGARKRDDKSRRENANPTRSCPPIGQSASQFRNLLQFFFVRPRARACARRIAWIIL